MNTKKSISPVVATALLLVVAVVAVVGFQGWFQTFSNNLFTKTEQQSTNNLGNTQIEDLIGNSLYFKNGNTENLSISAIKINGVNCNYFGNFTIGINEINVTNCISNLTTVTSEVVVYTSTGIYTEKFYVKEIISNSLGSSFPLNCSALGLVGGTWITVPGNSTLGTSDFCVMKFEAKKVGGVATSQGSGSPRVSLTQQQARANCSVLGTGYHLITENEWLTIAHNVEMVSSNWNSSIVGTGFLFSGHNDNSPTNALTVTNESNYYNGTGNSVPSNQKRVLILNNGEIVWDISGNVWEFTNDTILSASRYHGGDKQWLTYDNDGALVNASNVPLLKQPSNNWDADNGMGRYYDGYTLLGAYNSISESPDFCTDDCSPTAAFLRGGGSVDGAYAGVFALNLNDGPSSTLSGFGFRCVYEP